MGMFNTKLFGYDKKEVNNEMEELLWKINAQQRDIEYLREENEKFKQEKQKLIEEQSERN